MLSSPEIESRLTNLAVSKAILDTVILGGFGDCTYEDHLTHPYSLNLLELTTQIYKPFELVSNFSAEDKYAADDELQNFLPRSIDHIM